MWTTDCSNYAQEQGWDLNLNDNHIECILDESETTVDFVRDQAALGDQIAQLALKLAA